MAVNSSQPTIYFVILSCVCFSTNFNEDGNEIFDDSHAGFSVLVENIFIIDEHNDETCHFYNDAKGNFDDKHMGLRVLIWSLIFVNEHKDDEPSR